MRSAVAVSLHAFYMRPKNRSGEKVVQNKINRVPDSSTILQGLDSSTTYVGMNLF